MNSSVTRPLTSNEAATLYERMKPHAKDTLAAFRVDARTTRAQDISGQRHSTPFSLTVLMLTVEVLGALCHVPVQVRGT